MKKAIILCMAMLAAGIHAQGTYVVDQPPEGAIVRMVGDQRMLIYNEPEPGRGCFILRNDDTSPAKVLWLVDGVSVNDFEVMGGTAYFCGHYRDEDTMALIGMFDIDNVFGGGGVSYGRVSLLNSAGDSVWLRRLDRLDVFDCGGDTVMAMVGVADILQVGTRHNS